MQIAIFFALLLVVILLWRILSRPRIVPGSLNEWLLVTWYDTDPDIIQDKDTFHIQFIPIVGWQYRTIKYGPLPLTPPIYQVKERLFEKIISGREYRCYWIRDGAILNFSNEWCDEDDPWVNLEHYASYGNGFKIWGEVPNYFKDKITEMRSIYLDRLRETTH